MTGEVDELSGQPDPDSVVVALAGDPLCDRREAAREQYRLGTSACWHRCCPQQVVAIGKNYAAHAAEMGGYPPASRWMFPQTQRQRGRTGRPDLPPQTGDLHFEGELAVVIGRICRDACRATRATDVIHGATIANDVTARDLQEERRPVDAGRNFDSVLPAGAWIETDLDPHDFEVGRSVQTHLNGDHEADGTPATDLRHPHLIAPHHQAMTLLPGDVIPHRHPEGVGPMKVGDEVEISIANLGTLTNKGGPVERADPSASASPVPDRLAPSAWVRTALYNWAFARHHNRDDRLPDGGHRQGHAPVLTQSWTCGAGWVSTGTGHRVGETHGPTNRAGVARSTPTRWRSCAPPPAYDCFCTTEEVDARRKASGSER